jgi:hypothetical protein
VPGIGKEGGKRPFAPLRLLQKARGGAGVLAVLAKEQTKPTFSQELGRFPGCFIFNGLWPLKMPAHPGAGGAADRPAFTSKMVKKDHVRGCLNYFFMSSTATAEVTGF